MLQYDVQPFGSDTKHSKDQVISYTFSFFVMVVFIPEDILLIKTTGRIRNQMKATRSMSDSGFAGSEIRVHSDVLHLSYFVNFHLSMINYHLSMVGID